MAGLSIIRDFIDFGDDKTKSILIATKFKKGQESKYTIWRYTKSNSTLKLNFLTLVQP